jgi:hypothetical protein
MQARHIDHVNLRIPEGGVDDVLGLEGVDADPGPDPGESGAL